MMRMVMESGVVAAGHERYLPTSSRSRSLVAAGTASGRVMMAVASARAHSQVRAIGSRSTALAMTCCAVSRVLHQVRHDHLDRHRVVVRMPAVVVGDERERRVADLRFARELRFLQVGHADDVEACRAVEVRLGDRRELRPFHADVGAAAMHRRAGASRPRPTRRRSSGRQNGMREPDVRHQAVAEKRADPAARAIEELRSARRGPAACSPRAGCRPRSPTESIRRRAP